MYYERAHINQHLKGLCKKFKWNIYKITNEENKEIVSLIVTMIFL